MFRILYENGSLSSMFMFLQEMRFKTGRKRAKQIALLNWWQNHKQNLKKTASVLLERLTIFFEIELRFDKNNNIINKLSLYLLCTMFNIRRMLS